MYCISVDCFGVHCNDLLYMWLYNVIKHAMYFYVTELTPIMVTANVNFDIHTIKIKVSWQV